MKGSLVRTVKRSSLLITPDEVKSFGQIYDDVNDDALPRMIEAAVDGVENYLGRALFTSTYRWTFDCFESGDEILKIPRAPLQSITTIKYYPSGGGAQATIDSSDYVLDTDASPGRVNPASGKSWPSVDNRLQAVEVTFVAGYTAVEDVPEEIMVMCLMAATDLYDNRQMQTDRQMFEKPGFTRLGSQHRIIAF